MAMDSEISFEFGNNFNSSIIGADDSLKNSSRYRKLVCCLPSCILVCCLQSVITKKNHFSFFLFGPLTGDKLQKRSSLPLFLRKSRWSLTRFKSQHLQISWTRMDGRVPASTHLAPPPCRAVFVEQVTAFRLQSTRPSALSLKGLLPR